MIFKDKMFFFVEIVVFFKFFIFEGSFYYWEKKRRFWIIRGSFELVVFMFNEIGFFLFLLFSGGLGYICENEVVF